MVLGHARHPHVSAPVVLLPGLLNDFVCHVLVVLAGLMFSM
jgi:hypothetical protein